MIPIAVLSPPEANTKHIWGSTHGIPGRMIPSISFKSSFFLKFNGSFQFYRPSELKRNRISIASTPIFFRTLMCSINAPCRASTPIRIEFFGVSILPIDLSYENSNPKSREKNIHFINKKEPMSFLLDEQNCIDTPIIFRIVGHLSVLSPNNFTSSCY
jgi:hypothetical protein